MLIKPLVYFLACNSRTGGETVLVLNKQMSVRKSPGYSIEEEEEEGGVWQKKKQEPLSPLPLHYDLETVSVWQLLVLHACGFHCALFLFIFLSPARSRRRVLSFSLVQCLKRSLLRRCPVDRFQPRNLSRETSQNTQCAFSKNKSETVSKRNEMR